MVEWYKECKCFSSNLSKMLQLYHNFKKCYTFDLYIYVLLDTVRGLFMNTFSIDICFLFQAGSLAKKGLHEMEAIIGHCESMGCKSQVSTE